MVTMVVSGNRVKVSQRLDELRGKPMTAAHSSGVTNGDYLIDTLKLLVQEVDRLAGRIEKLEKAKK